MRGEKEGMQELTLRLPIRTLDCPDSKDQKLIGKDFLSVQSCEASQIDDNIPSSSHSNMDSVEEKAQSTSSNNIQQLTKACVSLIGKDFLSVQSCEASQIDDNMDSVEEKDQSTSSNNIQQLTKVCVSECLSEQSCKASQISDNIPSSSHDSGGEDRSYFTTGIQQLTTAHVSKLKNPALSLDAESYEDARFVTSQSSGVRSSLTKIEILELFDL
ncbi:uncharacterized protein LOC121373147 [Gigantopelta aegis]|uniref:uncharacterized protein LOC121373147 n=1 Tax=Gigantopelta aegis TaxID=1735272 RepID=UPI001B88C261|nr:uncharacterized protein LOC121373147 [Gigantopelta aegis]